QAAPDHPAVFRTGPDASFNTLALKESGISRDFKLPDGVAGKVERDADGEPTGILRNVSNYAKIPETGRIATKAEKEKGLIELFNDYNSVGITSIGDRNASPAAIELYRELRTKGDLSVRVNISHELGSGGSLTNIFANIQRIANHPLAKKDDDM